MRVHKYVMKPPEKRQKKGYIVLKENDVCMNDG